MKKKDISKWKRKDHYNLFKKMDIPYFSITTDIDITKFYSFIKKNEYPFFKSMLYFVMKTVNENNNFKLRINNENVIEYSKINSSFTYLVDKEIFSFCYAEYENEYKKFANNIEKSIEDNNGELINNDKEYRDNLIYITSIPWVSFKSISHPINLTPTDSIPRIAWGKFFVENKIRKLPFSVQVHHALMDGIHVGLFINELQEKLDNPEKYFN